jgi:hypothetical protein
LVKDRISVFPLMSAFFAGNLNFLPFGLTPVEVLSLMTVLYYLINYVALKRRPIDGGPRYLLFPMLVIIGIVLIHDHQISLKAAGGDGGEEGSRPGLLILLAFVAYLCGINIPSPSGAFLRSVPWWCLILACIGNVPYFLTTLFPSLAPYVYYVSGNVNTSAYLESLGGGTEAADVERNGAILALSGILQGILVSYFPINTWWRPSRWILIFLSLLCLYGTLSGGYRNGLLSFAMFTFLAAICYCRWRVLIILPALILVPFAIIFIQNEHPNGMRLPDSIQRTMSFLPGNWDPDVVISAGSSNDFRADVKRVYINEYLYKSPWIGNGFTFDARENDALDAMSKAPGVSDPEYFKIKMFLVSKNFHVGWISLYDAVGIIGSVAFVVLNLSLIWMAGRFIFQRNVDVGSQLFPVKVGLFCGSTSGLIGYFTTFGSFNQAMIGMCLNAVLLIHVIRVEQATASKIVPLPPQMSINAPRRTEIFSSLNAPPNPS